MKSSPLPVDLSAKTKVPFKDREFQDVRPNLRDLGFTLIGLAFGLIFGGLFTGTHHHHVLLIMLMPALTLTGTYLIRKQP